MMRRICMFLCRIGLHFPRKERVEFNDSSGDVFSGKCECGIEWLFNHKSYNEN